MPSILPSLCNELFRDSARRFFQLPGEFERDGRREFPESPRCGVWFSMISGGSMFH